MPSRRRFIGTGAAALALAGMAVRPHSGLAQDPTSTPGDDSAQGSTNPVVGTPTLNPAIGLLEAQEIALEGNSGAVVTEVNLDGDDGRLVYEVELNNDIEVDIDATTGEVIRTEQRGDDDNDDNDDNGDDVNDDDNDDDNGDDGDDGDDD